MRRSVRSLAPSVGTEAPFAKKPTTGIMISQHFTSCSTISIETKIGVPDFQTEKDSECHGSAQIVLRSVSKFFGH